MMKHELRITVFVLISIILASLFIIHPVRAADLGSARIDASSPLYFLKAVREVLELKFAGTDQVKAFRYMEFSIRRIREVKSLAGTSHEDLIEPTLEKYSWYLEKLNGNENLTAQLNVLQEVFKEVNDPKAKRSIRLAIFRISEKFEAAKPQACSFLVKEASSSALSDVERYVYKGRAEKCLL